MRFVPLKCYYENLNKTNTDIGICLVKILQLGLYFSFLNTYLSSYDTLNIDLLLMSCVLLYIASHARTQSPEWQLEVTC